MLLFSDYAWFLESVTIYDMKDKRIYEFPCGRWLSGQDDDQRTYRVLPVDRERAFVTGRLSSGADRHFCTFLFNFISISQHNGRKGGCIFIFNFVSFLEHNERKGDCVFILFLNIFLKNQIIIGLV